MTPAQPKSGRIECRPILAWVRRQPCRECAERIFDEAGYRQRTATEAHHFPPKGMGGAHLRDDMVIPLCREHHADAQAYRIPAGTQHAWVNETRARFLDECSLEDLRAYMLELERWKGRPFAELVPS